MKAKHLLGLDSILGKHLISLIAAHLRHLNALIPNRTKVNRLFLLIEHLIITISHKP
jgi:hypothetical protein